MSMVYCRACGKEIHETAPTCPHCGAAQIGVTATGADGDIPAGVKGWSWGAFLLNWIWAIGNQTWIGLIAIIPYVGFIMAIVLGFKGREWAWKAKKWESVEEFNRVQKKWSFWGVVISLVMIPIAVIGILAAIAIPAYSDYVAKAKLVNINMAVQPAKLAVAMYAQDHNGSTNLLYSDNWAALGMSPPTATAETTSISLSPAGAIAVEVAPGVSGNQSCRIIFTPSPAMAGGIAWYIDTNCPPPAPTIVSRWN